VRCRGSTTNHKDTGLGPGLALIDATLASEPEQVETLRWVVGNHALALSAARVVAEAMTLAPDFDEELVMEFSHVHLSTWCAYDDIVIRKQDRWRAASSPIRIARRSALRGLNHYGRHTNTDSRDRGHPPAYRPNVLFVGRGLNSTFGIAYAATLTVVHLATTHGRDLDDVLDKYRAIAATHFARPPGVLPTASR
jgi:hypothetical protein